MTDDYPRSIVNDYENDVAAGRRSHARVVRATFALESEDIAAGAAVYGEKCPDRRQPGRNSLQEL